MSSSTLGSPRTAEKDQARSIDLMGIFSKYGIYIVFVLMFIVLSFMSPTFLTATNILNMLRQLSINGIIAVGMTFVIITGGIDLSVGSICALAGIVACSFAHPNTFPVFVPVMMGLLVGLLCGFVNGTLSSRGGVAPFIATLGMMSIARGLTLVYNNGTDVIDLTHGYETIGGGFLLGIPVPVIVLLLVILLNIYILNFMKFGRYVMAIGGNEQAAKVSGINVNFVKTLVYCISGVLSAAAGIVLSSRVMSGTVVAGTGYELDAIAAVVIGGTSLAGGVGSIGGTIAGILIIGALNNGLDLLNVSSYYQQIVKGCIIIGAVFIDQYTHAHRK